MELGWNPSDSNFLKEYLTSMVSAKKLDPIPFARCIDWNKQKRDDWLRRANATFSALQPFTQALAKEERENVRQNILIAQQPIIDKYDMERQAANVHSNLIRTLSIGWMLIGFGTSVYLANNPDVVKSMVDAAEKITVRAIDEISEVIAAKDSLSKIIDAVVPF